MKITKQRNKQKSLNDDDKMNVRLELNKSGTGQWTVNSRHDIGFFGYEVLTIDWWNVAYRN